MTSINVRDTQAPLVAKYGTQPEAARVTDHASTAGSSANDPFHFTVEPMPGSATHIPVSVHRALGGPHIAPTPGDILCAALAACQESSIRMIANHLGVKLDTLSVDVSAEVDVRGTLMVDPSVPVGFQAIRCAVKLSAQPDTHPAKIAKLRAAAEASCVVLQTLRNPPPVDVSFDAKDPIDI